MILELITLREQELPFYTNDVHSHTDPFGPNEEEIQIEEEARRAVLVNQIRNQNKNTLLLDAGDIFKGTYFNYYGGELEFKLVGC